MNADSVLTRRLAHASNMINAINGGSIYPTFRKSTEEDHYRLEVSIPSVLPQDLNVRITNGKLFVTHRVQVDAFTFPQVLASQSIAPDVNLEEVYAEHHDEKLVVVMPFSTQSGGLDREIDIQSY